MKLLTKEHQESKENAKICYICKENLKTDHFHYKKEYRDSAHSICNLKYSVPKKII